MTRAAPALGDPALPDQRQVRREGQALGDAMFAAAGDPVRMRDALTDCLGRTGRQFGGVCVFALQSLSTTVGAMYPAATAPGHHYEGTPR